MGLANLIIPKYTYDDWVLWEGAWELIEGHPIAMSPTPIPRHQLVASEINTELAIALRKSGCKQCRVYAPLDYKISENTILVPDILIICGEVQKKFLDFPPALVVEILSPSTALKDRHTKFELYQQQGVNYYLIIDADKKTIEIFQLINGEYLLAEESIKPQLYLENDCTITPDFSNVFN